MSHYSTGQANRCRVLNIIYIATEDIFQLKGSWSCAASERILCLAWCSERDICDLDQSTLRSEVWPFLLAWKPVYICMCILAISQYGHKLQFQHRLSVLLCSFWLRVCMSPELLHPWGCVPQLYQWYSQLAFGLFPWQLMWAFCIVQLI